MKNVVAISFADKPLSPPENPAEGGPLKPWGRHFEPARLVSVRLRSRLEAAGILCEEGTPSPKGFGWYFVATSSGKRFMLAVCPDQVLLPHSSMTITARPIVGLKDRLLRRRHFVEDQNWAYIRPHFTAAVNKEFAENQPRWMTFDEWLQTAPNELGA